ncbi:MAG TPA: hypothetical protein VL484_20450 [Vicinamibacterales bacterium]|jgi:hypothetical protein|nr:hypothetical protein [Vicinamibacterales bacterium]
MESLNSPKIAVGIHCMKLRTKAMYIRSAVDPLEATLYDPYEASAYWCVLTQTALGPDRQPVRPDVCCQGRDCCAL